MRPIQGACEENNAHPQPSKKNPVLETQKPRNPESARKTKEILLKQVLIKKGVRNIGHGKVGLPGEGFFEEIDGRFVGLGANCFADVVAE